ncbi:hypothetical protein [Arthrobacter castelli]|uniref:hypothetical protein n=1 Tax=Arthrobacter castelli TaxID=271431 RepID=UPI00040153D2|nr:hypothetical protein [Arthrobacter castelli]
MKTRVPALAVIAAVVVIIAAAAVWWLSTAPADQSSATTEPVSGPATTEPTPSPTGDETMTPPADEQPIDGYGPQAATPAPAPTYTHRHVSPTGDDWKDTDRAEPQQVATAFLTVYGTRAADTDDTWTETAGTLATTALINELTDSGHLAIEGKAPTEVVDVSYSDSPVPEFGPDTPIRWSRTATVTINTEHSGRIEAQYRVAAGKTGDGWILTDVAADFYQVVAR